MSQAGRFVVAAALLVAMSCGAVPPSAETDASSSRTASPTMSSPAGICVNQDRPSPRAYSAMTYVEARHEILLFGGIDQSTGYLSDTWTWESGCWAKHTLQSGPTARAHAAMAYDRKLGVVVLTGGDASAPDGTAAFPRDTWLWDGSAWSQGVGSPPMAMPLAAYDDDLQTVVLVGFNNLSAGGPGLNGVGAHAEVWSWDGSSWHKVSSAATGPPSRVQGSLAFDSAAHQLVLFGGLGDGIALGDTWTWDGTTWTQINLSAAPSARGDASMAFLATTKTIVLFGGGQKDEWTWNGTAWLRLNPAHALSVPTGTAVVSDGIHLLAFGGADASGHNDVWSWDGNDWTPG